MTPPDLLRPGPRGLLQLLGLGRAVRPARRRRLGGGRAAHRARADDPRPLVRVHRAQGHAGHRRDHRRDGEPVHAGHRLRALPPRHGRDRRPARRVGLRPRRHGRAHPGPGARRARPGRRDPLRGAGGPHRGARRPGDRRGPRERRGVPRPDRGEQCRRQRDLPRPARPASTLPSGFLDAVSRISYESASLKINVALGELPSFSACPGAAPGPQHRGTIHICPDLDYIERAYDDAKYGRPSERPVLECTIPSVVDPTVAPPGRHLMSIFVQYAPYALRGASWDQIGEAFADRCFALLDEYAPNFSRSVLARQVLTPLDIERVFGLTGGNIFQGAMTPGQLFSLPPGAGLRGLPHAGGGPLPLRGRRAPGRRGDGLARAGTRPARSCARAPALVPSSPLEDREQVVEVVGPGPPTRARGSSGRQRPPESDAARRGPPRGRARSTQVSGLAAARLRRSSRVDWSRPREAEPRREVGRPPARGRR